MLQLPVMDDMIDDALKGVHFKMIDVKKFTSDSMIIESGNI